MKKVLFAFLATLFLLQNAGYTQTADNEDRIQQLEKRIDELRGQLGILAEEVERLRSGDEEIKVEGPQQRSLGLGPSASTVYSKKHGVSIAGYGEMLYENFDDETDDDVSREVPDQLDFLRAVVYFGYRFNDRFLFNSEIEFEHANTSAGGEVAVEFAHLDYLMNDYATLRGGMVLIPMGLVNEFHEPTVFLGARRPLTEQLIIPSTWRENGFGILGSSGVVDYRAYLIAGLNAAEFSSAGIRDGRQEGAESKLTAPAFVGRVDVKPTPGFFFGGSLYAGNSGFFTPEFDSDLKVGTVIYEAHAEYRRGGLELRGLYAGASLDDVAELNGALALTGSDSIGESLSGGYVQAGYNLLAGKSNGTALTTYLRYEIVDTQNDVPVGFFEDPAQERSLWTIGLEYRPIFNIVVKADYMAVDNDADTATDQFNILLGYSF